MRTFFDLTIEYAASKGFGLFKAGHFFWLAAALFAVLLLCRIYKSAPCPLRRRLRLAVAFSALALTFLRSGLLIAARLYTVGSLPLHLCALAVYVSALHALRPRYLTGQFLYAFCMPGALSALIFPDWSYYPFFHFITFSAFTLHILLAAYTIMQVWGGDIRPNPAEAPRCLLIMLMIAAPVYLFNRAAGTNFMFLNWPSPGSPLEWFSFLGRPGYLLGYIPLLIIVWAALYLPFIKLRKRRG